MAPYEYRYNINDVFIISVEDEMVPATIVRHEVVFERFDCYLLVGKTSSGKPFQRMFNRYQLDSMTRSGTPV